MREPASDHIRLCHHNRSCRQPWIIPAICVSSLMPAVRDRISGKKELQAMRDVHDLMQWSQGLPHEACISLADGWYRVTVYTWRQSKNFHSLCLDYRQAILQLGGCSESLLICCAGSLLSFRPGCSRNLPRSTPRSARPVPVAHRCPPAPGAGPRILCGCEG